MAYRIEFLPDAERDFDALDRSVKKEAAKKIDALAENPFLGKPLVRNSASISRASTSSMSRRRNSGLCIGTPGDISK